MPLPLALAPVLPIVLRLGALAAIGLATRSLVRHSFPGRTDQRAEDALDDLGEGVSLHRPGDRASAGERQTNATGKVVRTIRIGGQRISIDAALIARIKVRAGE